MAKKLIALGALFLIGTGCDLPDRVGRLEKETKELRADVDKTRAASDYDLQAKCSKDAGAWFKENWGLPDKDTVLLDYKNHYNRKQNKCFILVEWHYNSHFAGEGGSSWTNDMSITNVYENEKYGNYSANTYTYYKPTVTTNSEVIRCEFLGQKCTTLEGFNNAVRPYLND